MKETKMSNAPKLREKNVINRYKLKMTFRNEF